VQIHVEDLADHLAGRERRDDAKARWDALHPASRTWPPTSARTRRQRSGAIRASVAMAPSVVTFNDDTSRDTPLVDCMCPSATA
jgi:hypothetical protein